VILLLYKITVCHSDGQHYIMGAMPRIQTSNSNFIWQNSKQFFYLAKLLRLDDILHL
jgi:hypothetical protein